MSKSGLDWYKREPIAYLHDTQGLTAREHAVYSVVIELLYVHGGEINNDPKWIGGWISDMGIAAIRNTLASLNEKESITLVITENKISQKRAKNEAKTKEKLRENAQKNGKKGGEKSAEIRGETNKNNHLGEAIASGATQADKIREDKSIGGGGSACARDHADPPPKPPADLTEREQLLRAVGADPFSGAVGPNGKILGTMADMALVGQWKSGELNLSFSEILGVVTEVMARKRDGPVGSFKYFNQAMQRHAGQKNQPALKPIEGGKNEQNGENRHGPRGPLTPSGRAHSQLVGAFARAIPDIDRGDGADAPDA